MVHGSQKKFSVVYSRISLRLNFCQRISFQKNLRSQSPTEIILKDRLHVPNFLFCSCLVVGLLAPSSSYRLQLTQDWSNQLGTKIFVFKFFSFVKTKKIVLSNFFSSMSVRIILSNRKKNYVCLLSFTFGQDLRRPRNLLISGLVENNLR